MERLGFFFLSFVYLGLHLRHLEVLRLGVESQLQQLAYTPQPQQHQIRAMSASSQQSQILNALRKARDRTHVLMDTNRVH